MSNISMLLNIKLLRYEKLYWGVHISKSIFEKTFTETTLTCKPQIYGGPYRDTFSYTWENLFMAYT